MSDKPDPPAEKKPRRRSAPRKRKPAKKAAQQAPRDDANNVSPAGQGAPDQDAAPAVGDASSAAVDAPEAEAASPAPASRKPRPTGRAPEQRRETMPATAESAAAPAPEGVPGAGSPVADAVLTQADLRPGELIRVPLSVRWRDLDAFNHVNNSKYLSYLEEARLRWMLTVPGMGLDDNVAPVVAASTLNYRRPIGWPGDVVVDLFVERVGGSSLTIGHRIVDSRDGVLYCDGNVVLVWIDRTSGRAAPLPASVRTACGG